MNTYQLKLDLNKGPTYSVGMAYSGITLRQGDKRGCTVVAELYDHGTRFTEAGYTAYFVMGLPDREHYYREAATYSAGTATIIIDESLAASVAGDTVAYFELTKGGATYSTQGIKVSVLKDARADKTPGETYDSRIEQAIQELEDVIASIDVSIEADVAEWLDQHPEATTTVQDGSITYAKLHSSTKQRLNNKLHRALTAPVVTASDAYAAPPVALVVDGKSVQDGTPTPDAPVSIQSVESVGLVAAGRNLLSYPYYDGSTRTQNGVTFTANSDGSLHVQGTATATTYYNFANHSQGRVWTPGTYTISVASPLPTGTSLYFGLRIDGVNKQGSNIRSGDSQGVWTTQDVGLFRGYLTVEAGATVDTTIYVQIELGSTATPYQPYVGSTTPIPLDGHALRSLPDGTHDELMVDADGNVTLVQRVGALEIPADGWTLGANSRYRYYLSASDTGVGAGHYEDAYCTAYQPTSNTSAAAPANTIRFGADGTSLWLAAGSTLVDCTLTYILAVPRTIPLGTVSLPSMPAPDLTAWASCTPATDIELDYERSVTIAVERIEAAIAELATN